MRLVIAIIFSTPYVNAQQCARVLFADNCGSGEEESIEDMSDSAAASIQGLSSSKGQLIACDDRGITPVLFMTANDGCILAAVQ